MSILKQIKPRNFKHTVFCPTSLGNSELEQIVGKIVSMQKNINPEEWTPFTAEQYLAEPNPISDEKHYFSYLIHGGKPGNYELPAGLLTVDGDMCMVTEGLLSKISRFATN